MHQNYLVALNIHETLHVPLHESTIYIIFYLVTLVARLNEIPPAHVQSNKTMLSICL